MDNAYVRRCFHCDKEIGLATKAQSQLSWKRNVQVGLVKA